MEDSSKALIMIDLDAVLDTRVGALFDIDAVEALSILDHGFRDRKSDTLDGFKTTITNEQFHEAYENRGIHTLQVSRPTEMPAILCGETARLMMVASRGGEPLEDYCVILNVYPYVLSEIQTYEMAEALKELLGKGIPVRTINLPVGSSRLDYLKMRDITDYITYDIKGWIEREFQDCTNPEDFVFEPNISVWGPKLMISDTGLEKVRNELPDLNDNDNPFDILKVIYGPFVNINWMEVRDFSLVNIGKTA